MVGITESVPKAKMALQIEELDVQAERDQMLMRLGSALNIPEDYEIPIMDSQIESV